MPILSEKQDIPGFKNSARKVKGSPIYRIAKENDVLEKPLKRRAPFDMVIDALSLLLAMVKTFVCCTWYQPVKGLELIGKSVVLSMLNSVLLRAGNIMS